VIPPPGTRSSYTDLALCGALVGALLVLAHNVWSILSGRFDASDPFIQVMGETISSASAGAILSVTLGLIYSLLVQRL
jgi:ABC-type Fe3+ transport system permease subunit